MLRNEQDPIETPAAPVVRRSEAEQLRQAEWGYRMTAALGALAAVLLLVAGLRGGNGALLIAAVCFVCFWWAMVTSANAAETERTRRFSPDP